jgi:alpha-L-glutamate ligase-like protein
VVVEKLGRRKGTFITADRKTITTEDLKLHAYDILAGRFSMNDLPDIAYIEERIRIHPAFNKYAYHGTPDIGVVVFNRIPVMAFLRLPTRESGGRANMFQGAIACGLDLAAGVTTYAVQHTDFVEYFPETHESLRGIRIPVWEQVLRVAIESADAAGLGYMRADIVLQPSLQTPGKTLPKVLELNAQPGLKIQLCNKAGLKKRLERVEGLEVESAEKGIKIAQELFGDRSLAEFKETTKQIEVFETVEVVNDKGERVKVKTKVDTGAFRTSIDRGLAQELGLLTLENMLMRKKYQSALGEHMRDVIGITFYLAGVKVETTASVSDRVGLKRAMLIGRRDLGGFVIRVE